MGISAKMQFQMDISTGLITLGAGHRDVITEIVRLHCKSGYSRCRDSLQLDHVRQEAHGCEAGNNVQLCYTMHTFAPPLPATCNDCARMPSNTPQLHKRQTNLLHSALSIHGATPWPPNISNGR